MGLPAFARDDNHDVERIAQHVQEALDAKRSISVWTLIGLTREEGLRYTVLWKEKEWELTQEILDYFGCTAEVFDKPHFKRPDTLPD